MSLTDPDARNRRVGSALQPIAWVLAILSLATGPFFSNYLGAAKDFDSTFLVVFLLYVVVVVGFGLMLYYTASHRNALGIVAFVFAYIGGLVLILGAERDSHTHLPIGLAAALVAYGVAAILLIVYIFHAVAAHQTLANGVTTTATVTSAGINGMVNYVQHWKLTLKFTDQSGKDRWFHIGRTGLGYAVGQQFQIKYNGKNPASKRGIVVLDG